MPVIVKDDYFKHLDEIKCDKWNYINAFDNVTILFADIVGFTNMSPNQTVHQLCSITNCEKIWEQGIIIRVMGNIIYNCGRNNYDMKRQYNYSLLLNYHPITMVYNYPLQVTLRSYANDDIVLFRTIYRLLENTFCDKHGSRAWFIHDGQSGKISSLAKTCVIPDSNFDKFNKLKLTMFYIMITVYKNDINAINKINKMSEMSPINKFNLINNINATNKLKIINNINKNPNPLIQGRCGKILKISKNKIIKVEQSRYGPRDWRLSKNGMETLQVLIRNWSGSYFTLDVRTTMTVQEIKKIIELRKGIPMEQQRLSYKDKLLRNAQTVESMGINHGATIQFKFQLKGGMDKEELLKTGLYGKRIRKGKLTRLMNRLTEDVRAINMKEKREEYETEYEKVIQEFTELKIIADDLGFEDKSSELESDLQVIEEKNERINEMFGKLADVSIRSGSPTVELQKTSSQGWKKLSKLKKIEIPKFTGDVKEYERWFAIFRACVDSADGSKEEKLLHLRQYLGGEPLKLVEPLGFSAIAYDGALKKLHRRYGGEDRSYQHVIEAVESCKRVREGNLEDLDQLAEVLENLIIKLNEMNKEYELNNGFLYIRIIQKLPERMIISWNRWRRTNDEDKNVQNLFDWIKEEVNILRSAKEEINIGENKLTVNERSQNNNFLSENGKKWKEGSWNNRYTPSVRYQPNNFKSLLTVETPVSKKVYNTMHEGRKDQLKMNIKCFKCNGNHFLDQCSTFRELSVSERKKFVLERKLCSNCFKDNHESKNCKRDKMCRVKDCIGKHNYWLHVFPYKENNQNQQETHLTLDNPGSVTERRWFSLRTVPVILENNGKRIKVNALLDDASTTSYVSKEVTAELGINGREVKVPVKVIGGKTEKVSASCVKMMLANLDNTTIKEFKALALETVTGDLEVIDWKRAGKEWLHLKEIRFPIMAKGNAVDVLIGMDYLDLHQSLEEVTGKENEPVARRTPLGWTCVGGSLYGKPYVHQTNFIKSFFVKDGNLEQLVKRFWEIEEGDSFNGKMTKTDEKIFQDSKETMKEVDGRYEIAIPWKKDKLVLKNNRGMAERRLWSLERRFEKNNELREDYFKTIKSHIEKGYIKKVLKDDDIKNKWLLPHFPVIKRDRQTTKIRIVFDAAAKDDGMCLNDLIDAGPKLQNDLVEILLRFRRFKVAVVCDISEMFLQISVNKKDRPYLRFLWLEDGRIETYEFTRLVFGLNASPFLAQLVTQENAKKHQLEFPRASEVVIKSTYMDDSLDSVDTELDALQLKSDLKELWSRAGMNARKWMSNSEQLLKTVPEDDRAKSLNIEDDSTMTMKTLGLQWSSIHDEFRFTVKTFDQQKITKRNFLSWIARIFDPLGLLSSFIIRGKILMQEIWMSGVDWDDPLPEKTEAKIKIWLIEASRLEGIGVPRCLIQSKDDMWSLHVFSDASCEAYGAAIYLREERENRVEVRLIMSKSKVAPIKTVSIPRLELLGACVGLKLAKKVVKALEYNLREVTFWTDSLDVLYWIKQHSKQFKQFVANRVGSIQNDTEAVQWRHVPTKYNPADLLSRGVTADELCLSKMWWNGPQYLFEESKSWPKTELNLKESITGERKKITLFTGKSKENKVKLSIVNCFQVESYSSWKRLRRVYAWVLRFVKNSRGKITNRKGGELTVDEIQKAERIIIKGDQGKLFHTELNNLYKRENIHHKSKLVSLNPFVDEDGLIRCNSRIINAQFMSNESRFPIILEGGSWVTWLIVGNYHLNRHHYAGTSHLLSDISQKYWIIGARKVIRSYEKQCLICKRKVAKGMEQVMAPIPGFRFEEPLELFSKTAVDFAGPFLTIQGRRISRAKRYLCLFTCLQVRAVHLEMAYGLDTESFLRAFMRFVSRRGKPKLMLSDNGTNFVGASKELKNVIIDSYQLTKRLAEHEIRWIFNPPSAPHFGGVFEAMIKSVKKAMYTILTNADVTDEELQTVIIRAEDMVNSRPLTIICDDPKGLEALTPNHFMRDRNRQMGNEEEMISGSTKMNHRWRRTIELRKHLWSRWMKELVPTWCSRKKWMQEKKDVKKDDIMWILDKKNEVGKWPLAKVIETYPGRDCRTRVVKLRSEGKEIIRPICKLLPLELSSEKDVVVDMFQSKGGECSVTELN